MLVDVARGAENDFVGPPTGVLDQSPSLLCRAGCALFLDVRSRNAEDFQISTAEVDAVVYRALAAGRTGHGWSAAASAAAPWPSSTPSGPRPSPAPRPRLTALGTTLRTFVVTPAAGAYRLL